MTRELQPERYLCNEHWRTFDNLPLLCNVKIWLKRSVHKCHIAIQREHQWKSLHGFDSSGIYPSLLFSAQGILTLCTNRLPTACLSKTGPFFPSGKPVVPPCTRLPLSIPSALSPSPFHARRLSYCPEKACMNLNDIYNEIARTQNFKEES